ncbi:MAG: hypothetical protein JO154_01835 [Chitinophaga sp.]|uniref:hypothetical protein n=1 Tax=Chitinophaga sp. TaxID=1869181 RepID=UPI0025BEFF86|nr:hypothetical protein [Chitinophaga sp.]MBV8251320.1 hypothetical protein [Chitinophaga sp.]
MNKRKVCIDYSIAVFLDVLFTYWCHFQFNKYHPDSGDFLMGMVWVILLSALFGFGSWRRIEKYYRENKRWKNQIALAMMVIDLAVIPVSLYIHSWFPAFENVFHETTYINPLLIIFLYSILNGMLWLIVWMLKKIITIPQHVPTDR